MSEDRLCDSAPFLAQRGGIDVRTLPARSYLINLSRVQ